MKRLDTTVVRLKKA